MLDKSRLNLAEDEDKVERMEKFLAEEIENQKKNCIAYLKTVGDPLQRNNSDFLQYCEDMANIFSKHCINNLDEEQLKRLNVMNLKYSYKPLGQKKTSVKFVEIDVSDFEFFWKNYVERCLSSKDDGCINFNEQALHCNKNARYYLNWRRLLDPFNNDGFMFLRRVEDQLYWFWNSWIPIEDKYIIECNIERDMFDLEH